MDTPTTSTALSTLDIDPAELEPALRPFGESSMLPAAAYTSESVLAWERRHFFAGSWLCLGRTAELAEGCTHRAMMAGDVAILLTFDGTNGHDTVRSFANVCRHRAHHLLPAQATSHTRALVCPYHGWSYGLDGCLRAAPGMGEAIDPRAYGLVALPTVDWHGWLFINATATAREFSAHLGRLDDLVAPYQPGRLAVRARHGYRVAANWKIIVENYHECYHCPLIHPELCAVSPPNSGENWHEPGAWVGGSMTLREHAQTMSLDGRSGGVMLDGVDRRSVRYVGVFPSLLVSLHPDYVLTHRLEPISAGQTWVECEWLVDPAVTDVTYAVTFWDVTNRQDWAACESVQQGVGSPHFRPGPLSPKENAVYDWVHLVARAYLDPAGELS